MYAVVGIGILIASLLLGMLFCNFYGYQSGTHEYGNLVICFLLGGLTIAFVTISAMYLHSGSTISSVDDERYGR